MEFCFWKSFLPFLGAWVGEFQKWEASTELKISWRSKDFRCENSKHSGSQASRILSKFWISILRKLCGQEEKILQSSKSLAIQDFSVNNGSLKNLLTSVRCFVNIYQWFQLLKEILHCINWIQKVNTSLSYTKWMPVIVSNRSVASFGSK